jgi:tetratricopeptide (TPR) repeat protein
MRSAASLALLVLTTGMYGAVPGTLVPGSVKSVSHQIVRSAPISVACPSQSAARLIVEQTSGDAAISVATGDGNVRDIDAFDFGKESITIMCAARGDASLRIGSATPRQPVSYAITYIGAGTVTPDDQTRVIAEDLSTRSKDLVSRPAEWERAVSLSLEALSKWQDLKETDAVARSYLKLGDIFFARSDWEQASSYYTQAVDACSAAADLRCSAEARNNSGLAFLNQGAVEPALADLQIARDAWHDLNFQSGEATTSLNLGRLYWQTSEWQSAIRENAHARDLLKTRDPVRYSRALNNTGLVYLSMADYARAMLYFRMALNALPITKSTRGDRGRMWINFGRAEMFRGFLSNALVASRRALAAVESAQDRNGIADARNNIGQVLLKLGRRTEAEQSLSGALDLYEHLGDTRGIASTLHYSGQAAFLRQAYAEAEQKLQKALAIRIDRRLTDDAAETLFLLATVARKRNDIEAATALMSRALTLAEEVRSRFVGEPLRRSYFASKQRYVESYLEVLLAPREGGISEKQIEQAFNAAERARARALVEMLGEDRPETDSTELAELRRRRLSIRRDLNFKSFALAALRDTPQEEATAIRLRAEIDKALAEDTEVDSLMRSLDPEKAAVVDPNLVTLDELRERVLAPNETLFEYSLGENQSFLWVVTKAGFRLSVLPGRSRIEGATAELLTLLADIQGRQEDVRKESRFQTRRKQLALTLGFDPGWTGERLIVVPDGVLYRLPFAILPVQTNTGPSSLGLIAEVAQLPSATVRRILRDRSEKARVFETKVIAFGDPVYAGSDSRVPVKTTVPERGATADTAFRRLPFSQDELSTVERLVPQDRRHIVRGLDATRNNFERTRLDGYSLLLISTHAFADDREPELSSLVFSLIDRDGHAIDGFFRLYEVYDSKISPAFVVLSACETAAGKSVRGEGLIGLSRGFLFAGASGLLASLFRVDDEATSVFVTGFLEHLLGPDRRSPSSAALAARRDLAVSTRWKDPYYWGAFVLMDAGR